MANNVKDFIIESPPPDTARVALISLQTVITKLKELIVASAISGGDEKTLTAKLNNIIAVYLKSVKNEELKLASKKALVSSAKKWYYQISKTLSIANRNLSLVGVQVSEYEQIGGGYAYSIREHLTSGDAAMRPLIRDYKKIVRVAIKAIATEPPKIVTISKGENKGKAYVMPIRLRAELATRYEVNMDNLKKVVDSGNDLVWTSSHPNCSPRCAKYQGRLYSISGKSGVINGIRYTPLVDALKGLKGDGNGIISGYGCRHRLITYRQGSRAPKDFTPAEIKKEYAIDQKQRQMENRIRQIKTEERLLRASGQFPDEAKALRKKWQRLQTNYKAYSLKNGRAFYPERYVIDDAESDTQT